MPGEKRRIAIAGGGYAGTTLAVRLARRARAADNLEILLIEPNPCQQALSELDLVAIAPARPEFCELWLPSLFKKLPVTVRYERVHDVTPEERRFIVGPRSGPHDSVDYWRLVLATGSIAFVPPVPGLAEHAVTMWSVADAQELQRRIDVAFHSAAKLADSAARTRTLSVTVIGGGATGIEIVGTLGQMLPRRARAYGLDPGDLRVSVIEGRPDILYDLPSAQRDRAKRQLEKLGVQVVTGSMVERVHDGAVHLADGRVIDANVLVFCGGSRPDPDAVSWGMAADPSGRLVVDESCRIPGHPDVYAIGDVASFRHHEDASVLPMLAQYAMREAEHTADNILREARGQQPTPYVPHLHGQFVSIGPHWGIGWMGRFNLVGFPAIVMKRLTYVLYWHTVGGLPLAWKRAREMMSMAR